MTAFSAGMDKKRYFPCSLHLPDLLNHTFLRKSRGKLLLYMEHQYSGVQMQLKKLLHILDTVDGRDLFPYNKSIDSESGLYSA